MVIVAAISTDSPANREQFFHPGDFALSGTVIAVVGCMEI
jgi:hypothetical protein